MSTPVPVPELVSLARAATVGDDRDARVADLAAAGCEWLREVRVQPFAAALPAAASWQRRVHDVEESVAVLLAGTFDLQAGAGAWPGRGTRATPFAGRPVALFLPPRTRLQVAGGPGELLLVSARRPVDAAPPPTGAPAATKKPLLPLAGSNKAYDPATGEWRMQESFPLAPEALLPRRISQVPCGAVTLERVLPFGYKAAALCVDETVLAPGQELTVPLPELPAEARHAPELAVYLRCEEGASCLTRIAGSEREVQGEQVLLAGRAGECTLHAQRGRCYVLAVHAGPKA